MGDFFRSLRFRLTLSVCAAVVLVGGGATAFVVHEFAADHARAERTEDRVVADHFALALAADLAGSGLQERLRGAERADPDVAGAVILAPGGRPVAGAGLLASVRPGDAQAGRWSALRGYGQTPPPSPAPVGLPTGSRLVTVALPGPDGARWTLTAAVRRRGAQASLPADVRRLIVAGVLGSLLLAGALAFGIWRLVIAPLFALRRAIGELRGGAADTRLAWRRQDELGAVSEDFDLMAAELQQTYSRLESLALRDPLTDLLNHRSFHEALNRAVEDAEQGGDVAVVALDLDHFKAINDRYGHPHGDEVLRAVSAALAASVRPGDIVARIGGEEFAAILPGADAAEAVAVAERIRAAIGQLPRQGRRALSASAGVATLPADAPDAEELARCADTALYSAKRTGRDQTRRFDAEHVAGAGDTERAEIKALLSRPQDLRVVVQPWVELATGRTVGHEALSRFGDARRRPDEWFAQAHRCGLGEALEGQAVARALELLEPPPGTFVSVNLSPSALAEDAVCALLPDVLDGLVIEVTEHDAVTDPEVLAQRLEELRRRGARIALDDAGAGYAGLTLLMRLRPEIIKLDRSLVHGLVSDEGKVALVEALVRFARRTGADVCAEGVETPEELALLADLDVTYGQGYVLARPGEPWPTVPEALLAGLRDRSSKPQGRAWDEGPGADAADARLERICARLSRAAGPEQLRDALALVPRELRTDDLALSSWDPARRVVRTILTTSAGTDDAREFDLRAYPLTERVLLDKEAMQVVTTDPEAAPEEVALLEEDGYGAMLMLPVLESSGTAMLLEICRRGDRAYTRSEVNRARVVAHLLGLMAETGRLRADLERPTVRYRGSRKLASA